MTIYKIVRSIDKDYQDKNCEDILDRLVRPDCICRTCGNYRQYRPIIENTLTSIDIIPLLLKMLRKQEQLQESVIQFG
ncbi:hypothetical protein DYY65_07360 [Nitrososphaera sp. AFS]|nr:hypothetical protein [Nitrososphaera sp. AFS]